ncbi:MAG: GTP 3',8-cyclase MoaA [Saprospiraceae bacterium]
MLYDNHGRVINYMRLAVTDRCNLRCYYCMPEEGINYVARRELMTYEEMVRITSAFAKQGITKVRITGGEPFLRKDMMQFLEAISQIPEIEKINITSNGTLLIDKISDLKRLGITSINLSLDSLNRERFYKITRRDDFPKVMNCLESLIDNDFEVKINMVVLAGQNLEDIIPMVELAKAKPISVRFIEEMPFNGTRGKGNVEFWSHIKILEKIRSVYPNISKVEDKPFSTSVNYRIDGFQGSFGLIPAFSRTFCGSCNRIRLTPQGVIKTCLYDNGVFNVRDLLRSGATDEQLVETLKTALNHRAKDGFEAEQQRFKIPVSESMATIGG